MATREGKAALLEFVLGLIPEGRLPQGGFYQLIHIPLEAINAGPKGNVLVDRFRKWVGLLENHANAPTHLDWVDPLVIKVLAIKQHSAGEAAALDQIIHAVESPQNRGFAAAGRTNKGCYFPLGDFHENIVDSNIFAVAVADADILQR